VLSNNIDVDSKLEGSEYTEVYGVWIRQIPTGTLHYFSFLDLALTLLSGFAMLVFVRMATVRLCVASCQASV